MGVIVGVAISLGGWLVGGSFGQAVCALGLLLPGLLLQDFMRYAALAARRPRAAALNDCIQLLFQSVGIAFLVLGGDTAVWQILAAWGCPHGSQAPSRRHTSGCGPTFVACADGSIGKVCCLGALPQTTSLLNSANILEVSR